MYLLFFLIIFGSAVFLADVHFSENLFALWVSVIALEGTCVCAFMWLHVCVFLSALHGV